MRYRVAELAVVVAISSLSTGAGAKQALATADAPSAPVAPASTDDPTAVAGTSPFDWPSAVVWKAEFIGVESAAVTLTAPRPLRLFALRIDLDAEEIEVFTNDDNGDAPEETTGYKTSSFLRLTGCQAAVNGAPYWPVLADEGEPQNVVGLVVQEGDLVSPVDPIEPMPALVFRRDAAGNLRGAPEHLPIRLAGIETAVGGFGIVLRGGRVVADGSKALHPRTGAGTAGGGRTLLLVAVDGRQLGFSEGVTTAELGALLRRLGADDAINLDGGGTTAMVLAGAGGEPRVVNRPIHANVPGRERVAGSHLGVRARRLP
ncbi:MAG: phosphodiester glycosidase family protein [Lacipirellulaceae bacterium]